LATGKQWRRGIASPFAEFRALGKFAKNFIVEKFPSKSAIFKAKNFTFWGKLMGKFKILSTHNL